MKTYKDWYIEFWEKAKPYIKNVPQSLAFGYDPGKETFIESQPALNRAMNRHPVGRVKRRSTE